jgi:hypothetical protein
MISPTPVSFAAGLWTCRAVHTQSDPCSLRGSAWTKANRVDSVAICLIQSPEHATVVIVFGISVNIGPLFMVERTDAADHKQSCKALLRLLICLSVAARACTGLAVVAG